MSIDDTSETYDALLDRLAVIIGKFATDPDLWNESSVLIGFDNAVYSLRHAGLISFDECYDLIGVTDLMIEGIPYYSRDQVAA